MKKVKFNLGLVALVLGFGFVMTQSAFSVNTENAKRTMYTFYYDGPDYTHAAVTNESNWKYDPGNNLCSRINERACTIQVSSVFVNNPTSSPSLKSTLNLSAAAFSPNINYITGSSDLNLVIANDARP